MTDATPRDAIEAALADAARRLGVERSTLRVVSAEPVTWADGSLGCPAPGMLYTQALVPGLRIVLDAGGRTLEYHAGRDGVPAYCPPERVQPPATPGAPVM